MKSLQRRRSVLSGMAVDRGADKRYRGEEEEGHPGRL
jgi:hypothetical protein